MVAPQEFFETLASHGVDFYAGVPDSLLKEFCAYVSDVAPKQRHVITVNEGAAVALAVGNHLATGGLGLVYMQNSGFGNAVNPLTSLADEEVYSVPVVLLIGWRGEPGVKDEPQHRKQGKVTRQLLEVLGIPFVHLHQGTTDVDGLVRQCVNSAKERQGPSAILVSDGVFEKYSASKRTQQTYPLTREAAIIQVLQSIDPKDIVVSTTGKTSREIFEWREVNGHGHDRDFLTVGSMGHASHIALGIALELPHRIVWCIDGDGAVLMHMGSLATIGALGVTNLRHVMINNGAHESVGGQPTIAYTVNIPEIARACGYRRVETSSTPSEIGAVLGTLRATQGPCFFEIKVGLGARKDLGRPTRTPVENKMDFMGFLRQ